MATNIEDTAIPTRNALFSWKIICFKVEDELFSVPRNGFTAASEVFSDMFLLPSNDSPDGLDEDHPITLEGYKKDEFAALLKIMYPMPGTYKIHGDTLSLDLTKTEWIGALKLSTIWNMSKIRKYAIAKLDTLQLAPIEKVQLAREHRVGKWLREGVTALTQGDPTQIEDLEVLGWKTAALLYFIYIHLAKPQPQSSGRFTMASIKCGRCGSSSSLIPGQVTCSGCHKDISPESVLWSPNVSSTPGTQYDVYLHTVRCPEYPTCNSQPFSSTSFRCSQCGRHHYTYNNSGHARVIAHPGTDLMDKYFGQEIGEYEASDV
ncbi:hypothetical protein FA15DRAFT_761398 [Coprinopsis marcescibilis]|uniref:BTB domain-containing protein n=1 Tax=Coprinopsis marcescibilis TaxID=230819 RepID=A0A5C3K8Y5_COPMA|nr:hypothetical protein FA15DRAFT_761398 [Coprinopsis marcescibilis]